MSHLRHGPDNSGVTTPKEWLKAGTVVADRVNRWARRRDIVALLETDVDVKRPPGYSPACFVPATAEIEVDVIEGCGPQVTPADVLAFSEREGLEEYPALAGLLLHEAMHARHSRWDLSVHRELDPIVSTLVTMLEEIRIEHRGVVGWPKDAVFLRASALKLATADAREQALKYESEDKTLPLSLAVVQVAIAAIGRVDAGVLEEDDVAPIYELLGKSLTYTLVEDMRAIWRRVFDVRDDTNVEPIVEIAQDLLTLLREASALPEEEKSEGPGRGGASEGAGEGTGEGTGTGDADEPGDGDGDGDGESKGIGDGTAETEITLETLKELIEAAEEVGEDVVIEVTVEIGDVQRDRAWEAELKARSSVAEERHAAEAEMSKIFSKGTGPSGERRTGSRLVEERPPTAQERIAAVTAAQLLDQARYRDRIVTPTRSQLPPGRLRPRSAVQQAADRARGAISAAEPWNAKHRRHVEDPTLQIGVLVDISGSMNAAMEPMGVLAWVMSEASRRIGARCAQIYYGSGVFVTLRPGEYRDDVRIYSAPDGTERFTSAFKALDGALNLIHGSGQRLLVIASDMIYTSGEADASVEAVRRCREAGVPVVIIPFEGYSGYESYREPHEKVGASIVNKRMSSADIAVLVAKIAAAELTRIGDAQ